MRAIITMTVDVTDDIKNRNLSNKEVKEELNELFESEINFVKAENLVVILEPTPEEVNQFIKEIIGKEFTLKEGSRGKFKIESTEDNQVIISWEKDEEDECVEVGNRKYSLKQVFDFIDTGSWKLTK
ncbi:MAG: hypothetical protein IMY67_11175 [Bacteroidetes bacterium]|nr:hypothetical protein [Bacteroidota bacterium]